MLKKRVIPTLLFQHDRMVKGRQFSDFRDVGKPATSVRIYSAQDADELIFLDITPQADFHTLIKILTQSAKECFMPLTVGGGIRSLKQIEALFDNGADKVILTTSAYETPSIVKDAVKIYGSQSIVGGIDYRGKKDLECYINSGKTRVDFSFEQYIQYLQSLGVGEIFLNSIDRDGMMTGLDIESSLVACKNTSLPIVICGGAGNMMHLAEAFSNSPISGIACSSIFHFGDNNPIRARSYLKNLGIPMRTVK